MDGKRICIYVTYDKQKIVDTYIGYMLAELKTCVDYLVVVCNEPEVIKGKEILEKYADQIFYRENKGLDAGAYKDILCNRLGWKQVRAYDELLLVNDSFFGPLCPMVDIFKEMAAKKVDFWGLAKHGEGVYESFGGHIPEHIQSFFLVVRSEMLHSHFFSEYWENLPNYMTWKDVVKNHEILFTDYFVKRGFTFDVLSDCDANDSSHIENNYTQYEVLPYEMIYKRKFPFLKKKPLRSVTLNLQTQENFKEALNYIDKNTSYDVNYIYSNIIRTMNISDLYRNLSLRYIPSQYSRIKCDKKKYIAVFIQFQESIESVMEYLCKLKEMDIGIGIYAEKAELLKDFEETGYDCRVIELTEDYLEILTELSVIDYVCIIHDADMSGEKEQNCIGKSYLYNIWENLIKDAEHIENICACFEKDSWLGFLAPPNPIFSHYFGDMGSKWKKGYELVRRTIEESRLQCQVSFNKLPIAITDNFWIRGKILGHLKNLSIRDQSILGMLWTYIVQDAGFYSGIVESESYAAMNEVNYQYYLETLANKVRMQYGEFEDFMKLRKYVFEGALSRFCRQYSRLLIYGTGYMAEIYRNLVPSFWAYVVSDGQPKVEEIDGVKVFYLSEIEVTEDMGILVCLDEEHQAQVVPMLENRGIFQYLCI